MAIATSGARRRTDPDEVAAGILAACNFDEAKHEEYGRSLENFEPDEPSDGTPLLTSPRSLEACLRLGVMPEELRRQCVQSSVSSAFRSHSMTSLQTTRELPAIW